jgi:hypothetical protein
MAIKGGIAHPFYQRGIHIFAILTLEQIHKKFLWKLKIILYKEGLILYSFSTNSVP